MVTRRGFLRGVGALPFARRHTTTTSAVSSVIEVTPGTELTPFTQPSEVRFEAGIHDLEGMTIPARSVFTAVGGIATLRLHGMLILLDRFILNDGFDFTPTSPSLLDLGVTVAGKYTKLRGPFFSRFANQINEEAPVEEAPYPLIYDSLDPNTWADWNELTDPVFDFVYGGILERSPSNVHITNLVGRGKIGPGGLLRSHMSGDPAGAPARVTDMWSAHCEGAAVQLTKDSDVIRPGGTTICNWTNEPGSGNPGTGAVVESDGNKFVGALNFIGGDKRFVWAQGAKENVVKAAMTRTRQGGVGPAQDEGDVAAQFYDLTPAEV